MIELEYKHFLQTLNNINTPENVKKIANIILNHLREVIPLGTASGKRSKKIIELAQTEMKTANSKIESPSYDKSAENRHSVHLTKMKVGPFRGFAKEEEFDLDSKVVLIYGPNGTGKSSFCEALEFGLLGSVEEAEAKRFSEITNYLRNARTKGYSPPAIEAKDHTVKPDEERFRFCFVDKNRIDNFSRMTAQAPARQNKIIGALFSLEQFDDFVNGFSMELDGKYIDLIGKKNNELKQKKESLEGYKTIIADKNKKLEETSKKEQSIADSYQLGIKFDDFISKLGSPEHPGEIQKLEKALEKALPTKIDLKITIIQEKRKLLEKTLNEALEIQEELTNNRKNISFRNLFQAISDLKSQDPEVCPACLTSLSGPNKVVKDPFARASEGLLTLKHLSTLEDRLEKLKETQGIQLRDIYSDYEKALKYTKEKSNKNLFTEFCSFSVESESQLDKQWWATFLRSDKKGNSGWSLFNGYASDIESADLTVEALQAKRKEHLTRLSYLRALYSNAITLCAERKALEGTIKEAEENTKQFEIENKTLIENVNTEAPLVTQNKEIAKAYSLFVNMLNTYRQDLPKALVSDLGELIVKLYNGFNRSDSPGELLQDLKVPLSSDDRMIVAFQSDPTTYFDALHVMSEGHIRCIGLAILLAKNIKENCPILIFDDPVNAIDDDHREGIRRTVFENTYFSEKQILLTCHGEEFFNNIQQLLGANKTSKAKRFSFLPQNGENHIQIDFSSEPRNYLLAAQSHFKKSQIRNSLTSARKAMEALSNDIWRYLDKHGDGNLSLKMRKPKAPIELRNLVEQLKKQLKKQPFVHDQKETILNALSSLLGINGNSREWGYLNKGTHHEEDCSEFDRIIVKEIIDALDALDKAIA